MTSLRCLGLAHHLSIRACACAFATRHHRYHHRLRIRLRDPSRPRRYRRRRRVRLPFPFPFPFPAGAQDGVPRTSESESTCALKAPTPHRVRRGVWSFERGACRWIRSSSQQRRWRHGGSSVCSKERRRRSHAHRRRLLRLRRLRGLDGMPPPHGRECPLDLACLALLLLAADGQPCAPVVPVPAAATTAATTTERERGRSGD